MRSLLAASHDLRPAVSLARTARAWSSSTLWPATETETSASLAFDRRAGGSDERPLLVLDEGQLGAAGVVVGGTPPSSVAENIREIIESGTWQLRHAVGPDEQPFLGWRQSMTDEAWINWGALDDDAWYERVQKDFGLDARPPKYA